MTYRLTYSGQGVSNNQFYSGSSGVNGWKIRAGIKNKYAKIFSVLLLGCPKFTKATVTLRFNSRHDCDNTVGLVKILLDTMKGRYIPDDNKNHIVATSQIYAPELPLNTFEFTITSVE